MTAWLRRHGETLSVVCLAVSMVVLYAVWGAIRPCLWLGFRVWFVACVVIPYAIWGVMTLVDALRDWHEGNSDD